MNLNTEKPRIMFIDLNSAFATTEQQAHPSLRRRPMGVTNRVSYNCCIIACSYEAKAMGIKVGMGLQDVLKICPDFIVLESDPAKYHHVYKKVLSIMRSYSPNVRMQSIDEGVIDFHGLDHVLGKRSLEEIGYEIKQRVRDEIGSWMRINVGIAPNRFLAKQAASWHKPDGLDTLDHTNLVEYYRSIKLTDLTGISKRFKLRLNLAQIFTPIQFLEASADTLRRQVFHSVVGEDWYNRLRGYEVDGNPTKKGQVGRQFVLDIRTNDEKILLPRFHYLCETTGKKLRHYGLDARGILVWMHFQNGQHWYTRRLYGETFYSDQDIYKRALKLFRSRPEHLIVSTFGITCYHLSTTSRDQISLAPEINKQNWLTYAVDNVNERYGLFVVHSANTLEGKRRVKQKIPFGGTDYFELLL